MKPQTEALTDSRGWRYTWPEAGLQMDVVPTTAGRDVVEAEVTVRAQVGEVFGHMHGPVLVDLLRTRSREQLARYLATRAGRRGIDWAGLVEQACVLTVRAIRGGSVTAPATHKLADLMRRTLTPPRAVIDGILAEGCFILGGHPKTGKSWLMLGFGLAVAFGGAALGSIRVEQGGVLYLALEDSDIRMQARSRSALGTDEPPENFEYRTEWTRLDAGGLEELEAWLVAHPDTRLVMVDTLAKARGAPATRGSGRLYDEDYTLIAGLQDLAGRRRVCILVSLHLRKGGADDPLEMLSGTMGIAGGADGILILQRRRYQNEATLAVIARDMPRDRELGLSWDAPTASWLLVGDAADMRLSQERKAIIGALRDAGEPLSPKDLADVTELPYGNVRRLLFAMTRESQVQRAGRGSYTVGPAAGTNDRADRGMIAGQAINLAVDKQRYAPDRDQRDQAINELKNDRLGGQSAIIPGDQPGGEEGNDRLIAMIAQKRSSAGECPQCGGRLRSDRTCERCQIRLCTSCGEETGSILRRLCVRCAMAPAGKETG